MLQVAEVSVWTLNRGKGHKIVRSVTVYQYSTTYATANRVTDSGEHRSKYHVRATEDDILSEIRRKDRIAISEMKGRSCEKITHLLKTAGERQSCPSASRQVAYSKMTHKLRVRHKKAMIRIMTGSCSHAIRLFLQ